MAHVIEHLVHFCPAFELAYIQILDGLVGLYDFPALRQRIVLPAQGQITDGHVVMGMNLRQNIFGCDREIPPQCLHCFAVLPDRCITLAQAEPGPFPLGIDLRSFLQVFDGGIEFSLLHMAFAQVSQTQVVLRIVGERFFQVYCGLIIVRSVFVDSAQLVQNSPVTHTVENLVDLRPHFEGDYFQPLNRLIFFCYFFAVQDRFVFPPQGEIADGQVVMELAIDGRVHIQCLLDILQGGFILPLEYVILSDLFQENIISCLLLDQLFFPVSIRKAPDIRLDLQFITDFACFCDVFCGFLVLSGR